MNDLKVEYRKIKDLKPYKNNAKIHSFEQIEKVADSINEFGFTNPVLINDDFQVIAGHCRLKAAEKLNITEVPTIQLSNLTSDQVKAYTLADNRLAELADWNMDLVKIELEELQSVDFDIELTGFDLDLLDNKEEIQEETEDVPSVEDIEEPITKQGDIWLLGNHRLMCGDSTSSDAIDKLMDGKKADMCFTDPPYGMKKENVGVANDNLNFDDLLEFNRQWIPLTFNSLTDVGSWYCWGIDEPLMDIYSNIIKPMANNNEVTFRNLITWDKGHGQGQMAEDFRMYPVADEKCLFVIKGVQGFNTNADNYYEGWESIREYLYNSRMAMGWDIPTMKRIVGHSDLSRDHWTSKSQWSFITEKAYKALQDQAEKQRSENGINNDAFKKEYSLLKKEYEKLKMEFYNRRGYFNNTHDNMNNVWHFKRTSNTEREHTGNHATPKPLDLCSRAIMSSCRDGGAVIDVFGGSGSTLIACEQLNRSCYMMELYEKYCDVIIKRWQNLTNKDAILESTNEKYNNLVGQGHENETKNYN